MLWEVNRKDRGNNVKSITDNETIWKEEKEQLLEKTYILFASGQCGWDGGSALK